MMRYLLRRGALGGIARQSIHDWATSQAQSVNGVSGAHPLARLTAIEQVGMLAGVRP